MTRVVHRTRYAFDDVVAAGSELETCLSPPNTEFHQILLRPRPAKVEVRRDDFGNERHRAYFDEALTKLEVIATSVLADGSPPSPDPNLFLAESARVPLLEACRRYAVGQDPGALVARIRRDFHYDRGATSLDTPLARFIEIGRGVCQDFAHFAIACLRSCGVPARYVSGYGSSSAVVGRAHAWAAAYVDGNWLDVDATLGRVGPLDHIPLATGRDYDDVPALRGTLPHRGSCHVVSEIAIS